MSIFTQKLNIISLEFQNLRLIKNFKVQSDPHFFIKIFYNEALVIKTLIFTIGVIICNK